MKIIKVFQENNEMIELVDNDETSRNDYMIQLKKLLESNDVMILETSSASMIIRPHKVNSILVIDDSELVDDEENDDKLVQDSEDFIRG